MENKMFVEILAGILVRGLIVEIAKKITNSTFLGMNKVINILGVSFFIIAILSGEKRVGAYIGFFLIDILAVTVMIYKRNRIQVQEQSK
jgi:hypothetical protein